MINGGGGKPYVTGVAAPLPLPPPFPPPRVVELGTGTVDVLKWDILVDGSGMEVIDGSGTGVTITPPGGDGDGTTSTVDVLRRDILVDGSGMGVVDGNGTGVTITLLGGDGDGTTIGGSVGTTTGLILTVVVGEISPPPGSVVGAPPLTGKPAASTQV